MNIWGLFLGVLMSVGVQAQVIADSGNRRVQMLELYSSESCSSCPPADQWIAKLKDDPNLWKTFVPVVFHVDYWNHLSWKDGYSSDVMTERQISISKLWKNPSVYTPGFVLNGQEWLEWRKSQSLILKQEDKNYGLRLILEKIANHKFKLKISGTDKKKNYVIRYALLGMNIDSQISDGENSGKLLQHNFLVLKWGSEISKNRNETLFSLDESYKKNIKKAIAVWIEEDGRPEPLQVVGGYL